MLMSFIIMVAVGAFLILAAMGHLLVLTAILPDILQRSGLRVIDDSAGKALK
jgi:hypothetical protein